MGELLQQLPSLGISGLLFVMWWTERQERARAGFGLVEMARSAAQSAETNRQMLDALRSNTEALAGLREELRVHRTTEMEVLARLSRQLEQLEAA